MTMINFLALPTSIGIGNFQITFYSIFILTGAILALLIGMVRVKKLGYDPHRLENLFLVAFPSGLIGARIWYIICQWHEFAPAFQKNFFEGLGGLVGISSEGIQIAGLAIEGGVFLGVVAGLIFVMKYRKEMKPLDIGDVVIPGILLAQAIGRWGNFFNQEVYGLSVDPNNWKWLGNWFIEQMTINGEFKQPLFLIESLINIGGFLVLTFVLGNKYVKKYLIPGTISFGYFIWYGTVRAILEPLRDKAFIMTDYISVFTSIVFIIFGVLGIIFLYVYRYYLKRRFNMHLFDRKINDNVYVDFASDNYLDKQNNVIEKPNFDKYGEVIEKPVQTKKGKKKNKKEDSDGK